MNTDQSTVILRYAGKDATAAYDEIHAPGILQETLPSAAYKGLLDQADIINLPQDQQDDTEKIEKSTGQIPPTQQYEKPELHKLISLHEFEDVAHRTLTEKAWAFYSSAATDLVTHHANSQLFRRIMLRPRVMRSVPQARTMRSILGFSSKAPFFVSPAAMARLAHKDGELALARGCASEGIIQCVCPMSHFRIEVYADIVFADFQQCLVPTCQYCRSWLFGPDLLLPTLRQCGQGKDYTTITQSAPARH